MKTPRFLAHFRLQVSSIGRRTDGVPRPIDKEAALLSNAADRWRRVRPDPRPPRRIN